MTAPEEQLPSYPGLAHFRCGHGLTVDADGAGPSVWMVATDTDRTQQGVTMMPGDAVTIAAALIDSAARTLGPAEQGAVKLVGGIVETAIRAAITGLRAGGPEGVELAEARLRWLLGERV